MADIRLERVVLCVRRALDELDKLGPEPGPNVAVAVHHLEGALYAFNDWQEING